MLHIPTLTRPCAPFRRPAPACLWFPPVAKRASAAAASSLSLLLLSGLLSGCASPRTGPLSARRAASADEVGIVALQYAPVANAGAGHPTLEVFVENRGASALTFRRVLLDERELLAQTPRELERLAGLFGKELHGLGEGFSLDPSLPEPDADVTWWQYYPSGLLPPGGTVVLRLNLKHQAVAGRRIVLVDDRGREHAATIPRFRAPERTVRTVSANDDFSRLFVQYDDAGAPLSGLTLNHAPVESFRVLQPAHDGLAPVVAFAPPAPLGQGEAVALTLHFADGSAYRTLTRAVSGIMLDAPNGWRRAETLPADVRDAYGLDPAPAIAYLPFDVACGDTRAGRPGAGAMNVVDARHRHLRDAPGRLSGVEFCTAIYRAIWNVYGPIADAVFIKPYQLHWGPDATRFIEHEEARIVTAREAAAPRPVVWVPERFKRERHIEAEELRVMAWMALANGVKGIRYHFWMNDVEAPFAEAPALGEGMQALNAEIRRLAPILGPLVPVDTRIDRRQGLKIYEGWSGDAGILLLVRNMNYRTDARANANGRAPRFRVEPRENVTVTLDLPPWLGKPGEALDPLSGESLERENEGKRLSVSIPRIETLQLIWIENGYSTNPLIQGT